MDREAVTGALDDLSVGCATSADNSRAICVPLSRKSSHPSVTDTCVEGVWSLAGLDLGGSTELAFDAGSPGNLKLGFGFATEFALGKGGVGFLVKLAGGTRPGMEGILKLDWDVSRGRAGNV